MAPSGSAQPSPSASLGAGFVEDRTPLPRQQGRRRRPKGWSGALLLSSFALAACSKDRPHVERITVQSFEGRDVVGITAEELQASLGRKLEAARFVVLKAGDRAPDGAATFRASLVLEAAEPDPEQGAVVHVGAVLTLRPKGGDEGFDVEAREKLEAKSNSVDDLQGAAREALQGALSKVAAEARALIDLDKLKDDEVVRKLDDESTGVRDAAVRLLARRHHKAVLPVLLGRLKTDDVDEIRRTMGLLVELRDATAVPPLIDASRAKNAVVQREIVFALGAIGGDEAEAYLYVVAQGHDDPLVRASAEQALEELNSRAKRKHPGEKP